MTRRRLFLFIFLNILVSAMVTVGILFLYDKFGRPVCSGGVGGTSGITITAVNHIGDQQRESITVINNGEESVVLTGWIIRDSESAAYTFPQLTIFPGGEIQVHTKKGDDSPTDLYWGLSDSAWEVGELVVLYDTQGLARAFYRIP